MLTRFITTMHLIRDGSGSSLSCGYNFSTRCHARPLHVTAHGQWVAVTTACIMHAFVCLATLLNALYLAVLVCLLEEVFDVWGVVEVPCLRAEAHMPVSPSKHGIRAREHGLQNQRRDLVVRFLVCGHHLNFTHITEDAECKNVVQFEAHHQRQTQNQRCVQRPDNASVEWH